MSTFEGDFFNSGTNFIPFFHIFLRLQLVMHIPTLNFFERSKEIVREQNSPGGCLKISPLSLKKKVVGSLYKFASYARKKGI